MTLRSNPDATRAWQQRTRKPLSRSTPLLPGRDYRGLSRASLTVLPGGKAMVTSSPRQTARDTIPPAVRRIVTARDMGLCVYCGKPAVHQHHRRIKGMGGDTRPHTDCPCNLISLCHEDHESAHGLRFFGLTEGLIVPRSTPQPGALPVRVMASTDGTRTQAWPSCDGRWYSHEPDGGDVA